MKILIIMITSIMIVNMSQILNPLKLSLMILVSTLIMMLEVNLTSSMSWMPTVFSMLFMGGIIMIFMILSSIFPNEKMKKSKNLKLVIILMIMMYTLSILQSMKESTLLSQMKSFLNSGMNMTFMITMILIYFFSSMSMMKEENSPMRNLYCQKELML